MTTKDTFLADPAVQQAAAWVAARFDRSSRWTHAYADRKTGTRWRCDGLADAARKYSWRDKSWPETKFELDGLRCALRDAVRRENADAVLAVCREILVWGGVAGHNVRYLETRKSVLIAELQHLCAVLGGHRTPSPGDMRRDPSSRATECRMNAGFVKIYSLLGDNCVMYDGRVGAALGLLVRQFCEDKNRSTVPRLLAFAFGIPKEGRNPEHPKLRDPSGGSLRFPRLRPDARFHTAQVMRANWFLRRALEIRPRSFSEGEDGFHELAAGLFMVGYDLQPALAGGAASPKEDRRSRLTGFRERTRQLAAMTAGTPQTDSSALLRDDRDR